jgi:hypothetical protein
MRATCPVSLNILVFFVLLYGEKKIIQLCSKQNCPSFACHKAKYFPKNKHFLDMFPPQQAC